MYPTVLGEVSVMQVLIQEYRNGVIVGTIERDIQLRVIDCPNNDLPEVNGIDGSGVFTASICANEPYTFFTNALDTNATDIVTMTWNGGITNGVFITDGANKPTGTFTWTPVNADISTIPHCFTVNVTDDNCPFLGSQTFSFCLTVEGVNSIISSANDATCFGDCDGDATVSAFGGVTPYTYLWSDGQNTTQATGLCAGSYTITTTDGTGCKAISDTVIGPPDQLLVSISGTIGISCLGGSDGSATAQGSGGTAPYTYSWSNGSTGATGTGFFSGTHSVTITDSHGCMAATPVTITGPLTALAVSASVTDALCNGNSDGTLTAIPIGGNSGYSYLWSNGQSSQTAVGLVVGSYTVTVQDVMGCAVTSIGIVGQPATLIANSDSVFNRFCSNPIIDGMAYVSGSGGTSPYSFVWSNGSSGSPVSISPGNYSYTVSDANGCMANGNVQINDSSLTMSLANVNSICGTSNGSFLTNVDGGLTPYIYNWSSGHTSGNISGLSTGVYTLSVNDQSGCLVTATDIINDPVPLTDFVDSSYVSCNGGVDGVAHVSAWGGTTPYVFNWTNGQTDSIATGLAAGVHYVTVVDDVGCTNISFIELDEPSGFIISITPTNVSCFSAVDGEATIVVTGATSPYTYQWGSSADNQTTQTAVGLVDGTYIATVTDANGCTVTSSTLITEPTGLTLLLSGSSPTCNGNSNGSASVVAVGATSPYSYIWNNNALTSTNNNIPAGQHIVSVTDASGCTQSDTILITEPLSIASSLTVTDVSCNGGNDGIANVVATGGTSPYNYQWDINTAFQNGATATGLATGSYIVSINDINNCSTKDTANIGEPSVINIITTPTADTICPGELSAIGVLASGGSGGYTYQWSNGLPSNQSLNVSPGDDQVYFVTVYDSNGCDADPASVTVSVLNFALDSIQMSTTDNTCPGEPGTVSGSYNEEFPPYVYSWGGLTETNPGTYVVSPNESTWYYLTVTDQCGNSISDSILFNVFTLPDLTITPSGFDGCEPLSVQFDVLGDESNIDTYYWNFGDGYLSNLSDPIHLYTSTGFYIATLEITTNDNCDISGLATSAINVIPSPTVDCNADPSIMDIRDTEVQFESAVSEEVIYSWSFGDGDSSSLANPIHQYPDTGTYLIQVVVTNQYGCTGECNELVVVNPYFEVKAPNAFTPSAGGGNGGTYDPNNFDNTVFIPFTDYVVDFHMEIFNRWGELIFVTDDINIGWDGYYRGELCQQDVYVWRIDVTYTDGSEKSVAGDLTLIR